MIAQEIGCRDAVIFTVDSDIVILTCNFVQMLEINLLVQIGSGNSYRVIHVNDHTWSDNIIQSLPSLHAISGCDAVSAFHGIGKATWLSKIQKREEYMDALRLLAETLDMVAYLTLSKDWCVICTVGRRKTELITHGTKFSQAESTATTPNTR